MGQRRTWLRVLKWGYLPHPSVSRVSTRRSYKKTESQSQERDVEDRNGDRKEEKFEAVMLPTLKREDRGPQAKECGRLWKVARAKGHGPSSGALGGGAQPCDTGLLTPGLWGNKPACILKLRQKRHTQCKDSISAYTVNDHHSRSNICHQMELQSFLL